MSRAGCSPGRPASSGQAVHTTGRRNHDAPLPNGRYIAATADATPMERWIAARLDRLAAPAGTP
jgi:hypothetical protein